MKNILFFLVLFLFVGSPQTAFAHMPGQPPFSKINGIFANSYPVPSSSNPDFILPQDIAPEKFLVRDTIRFEIETSRLPVPKEIVEKTLFEWDFGDGTKGKGLGSSHAFTKIGSYIVVLYANDGVSGKQMLESMLVNILPTKEYVLPQAILSINGKSVKDPTTDIITLPFGEPFLLEGSLSKAGSSPLVLYAWDLGDGTTANKKELTYSYKKDIRMVFPVLRVTNKNGFFADTTAQVHNSYYTDASQKSLDKQTFTQTVAKKETPSQLPYMLWGVGMLVIGGIIFAVIKKG